mgnify:CR=1 FL=1
MSPLGPKKKGIRFNLYWMYSLIALVLIGLYYMNDNTMSKEVNWTEFEKIAKEGGITRLTVFAKKDHAEAQLNDSTAKAVFKTDKINGKPVIYTNIPSGDSFAKTLDTWKKEDGFNAEVYYENSSDLTNILWSVGPFILLIVFWIYLARRMTNQGGGGSGGVFNVGKAKAQLFDKDGAVKVTFNDVAGLSEAKQEVEEIVEFLKNPNRYTDLGGKIPKGALLVGPPGTGKTLLAKAVAGEANVPFFSLSGSDFVEMFVGVGASRVRDLFRQAKEKAPCIVFIDEIDTSLHPALVKELVALYADAETNPHGSQLIFTTHDVSLINQSGLAKRLLAPDQIWLVEKNKEGVSELFPVTNLGIRNMENIGKNYLNGVYGAIPRPDFHTAFAQIVNVVDA